MTACLSYAPPRCPKEHHFSFIDFKIPTLHPLVLLIRVLLILSSEHWCKVTDRGKGESWENKTCPTATLSTTNPYTVWTGIELQLPGSE